MFGILNHCVTKSTLLVLHPSRPCCYTGLLLPFDTVQHSQLILTTVSEQASERQFTSTLCMKKAKVLSC